MATEILTCYLIQGKTLLNVFEVLGAAGVILFHHTAWSVSKADGKGRKRLGCQKKKTHASDGPKHCGGMLQKNWQKK